MYLNKNSLKYYMFICLTLKDFIIKDLKFNARFYGFIDEEEVLENIEKNTKKTGVFQDQLTNKLILSFGICLEDNLACHKTIKFFSETIKKDPSFHKNIIQKHILNITKEIIEEILNKDDALMTFHEKKIKIHLDSYLKTVSLESKNKAIFIFTNILIQNLDIMMFTTHLKNIKTQTDYNILFAPTIFTFINTSFTDNYKNKSEYMIFQKQIIIESEETMEEVWIEIFKKAIEYYIYAVFDFKQFE